MRTPFKTLNVISEGPCQHISVSITVFLFEELQKEAAAVDLLVDSFEATLVRN